MPEPIRFRFELVLAFYLAEVELIHGVNSVIRKAIRNRKIICLAINEAKKMGHAHSSMEHGPSVVRHQIRRAFDSTVT